MAKFEKIAFYIPSSVRYVGPFVHVYEECMPRLANFFEMALFYRTVGSIGQFRAERWSREGIEETLAFGNTGGMPSHRGFVMDYCGEAKETHMFDVFSLFNEFMKSDISSPDSFGFDVERLNESSVRVEFGYSHISDFDRAKEYYDDQINKVSPAYLVALDRAIEAIARRFAETSVMRYQDAVVGAPEAEIRFQVAGSSASHLDFEWEITDPTYKDDYEIKSAFKFLVSEILPLQIVQEIGADPAGISSAIFESFDRVRAIDGASEIIEFQDIIMPNIPRLSERIYSGEIKAVQLEKLLERSEKWRNWTGQIGDDTRLIQEYFKEVSADPILEKLPSKAVRFSGVTACGVGLDLAGTGGLGTLGALGIAAFDAFFLQQCVDGWRPQKFIEKDLMPLLNT